MSLYDKYILPHFLTLACGSKPISEQRQKVVPQAEGRILEVGMGSGLNLPFYDSNKVDMVWGLEPAEAMRAKAAKKVAQAPFQIELLDLPGEQIPLDENSVDTVLLTYTLCTIPDWQTALLQMRRVLKPSGKLIFCEHGEAPDAKVLRMQQRINPVWKKIAGGCNLHRPIPQHLTDTGFTIENIQNDYLRSTPKFAGYNYWGLAKIR